MWALKSEHKYRIIDLFWFVVTVVVDGDMSICIGKMDIEENSHCC